MTVPPTHREGWQRMCTLWGMLQVQGHQKEEAAEGCHNTQSDRLENQVQSSLVGPAFQPSLCQVDIHRVIQDDTQVPMIYRRHNSWTLSRNKECHSKMSLSSALGLGGSLSFPPFPGGKDIMDGEGQPMTWEEGIPNLAINQEAACTVGHSTMRQKRHAP